MSPRQMIAEGLRNGCRWARSFQPSKRTLEAMVADGEVHRVAPPNGRARNMVELTGRGWIIYFGENLPVSRLDNFAELVADGLEPADAGRILNITRTQAEATWREICAQVGVAA